MNFAYYIFLLLIIFLYIVLFNKNFKYSPKKIKIYMSAIVMLGILKNITLIILCVVKKANIVLMVKNLVFLEYATLPLMALTVTYIFMRSEKIKFLWSYVIGAVSLIIYYFILKCSGINSEVSAIFGFIITLKNELIMTIFSAFFLGIIIIAISIILDKPYVNKKGLVLVLGAVIIIFAEQVIVISGIKLFPYPVIGEMLFLIIMNYAIGIFKK